MSHRQNKVENETPWFEKFEGHEYLSCEVMRTIRKHMTVVLPKNCISPLINIEGLKVGPGEKTKLDCCVYNALYREIKNEIEIFKNTTIVVTSKSKKKSHIKIKSPAPTKEKKSTKKTNECNPTDQYCNIHDNVVMMERLKTFHCKIKELYNTEMKSAVLQDEILKVLYSNNSQDKERKNDDSGGAFKSKRKTSIHPASFHCGMYLHEIINDNIQQPSKDKNEIIKEIQQNEVNLKKGLNLRRKIEKKTDKTKFTISEEDKIGIRNNRDCDFRVASRIFSYRSEESLLRNLDRIEPNHKWDCQELSSYFRFPLMYVQPYFQCPSAITHEIFDYFNLLRLKYRFENIYNFHRFKIHNLQLELKADKQFLSRTEQFSQIFLLAGNTKPNNSDHQPSLSKILDDHKMKLFKQSIIKDFARFNHKIPKDQQQKLLAIDNKLLETSDSTCISCLSQMKIFSLLLMQNYSTCHKLFDSKAYETNPFWIAYHVIKQTIYLQSQFRDLFLQEMKKKFPSIDEIHFRQLIKSEWKLRVIELFCYSFVIVTAFENKADDNNQPVSIYYHNSVDTFAHVRDPQGNIKCPTCPK